MAVREMFSDGTIMRCATYALMTLYLILGINFVLRDNFSIELLSSKKIYTYNIYISK